MSSVSSNPASPVEGNTLAGEQRLEY